MPAELFVNDVAAVGLGTLTASMDNVQLTLPASASAPAALQGAAGHGQFRVVVDTEVMVVAATPTGAAPWTILLRGAEGSTAAAHSAAATIWHLPTAAAIVLVARPRPMQFASGLYYAPGPAANGSANTNKPVMDQRGHPFTPVRDVTLNAWQIQVVTAGSADAVFKAFITEDKDGKPGNLVADLSTVATAATGQKTGTISVALKGGKTYWCIGTQQGTTTAAVRGMNAPAADGAMPLDPTSTSVGSCIFSNTSAGWTGAAPTTFLGAVPPADLSSQSWIAGDQGYTITLKAA